MADSELPARMGRNAVASGSKTRDANANHGNKKSNVAGGDKDSAAVSGQVAGDEDPAAGHEVVKPLVLVFGDRLRDAVANCLKEGKQIEFRGTMAFRRSDGDTLRELYRSVVHDVTNVLHFAWDRAREITYVEKNERVSPSKLIIIAALTTFRATRRRVAARKRCGSANVGPRSVRTAGPAAGHSELSWLTSTKGNGDCAWSLSTEGDTVRIKAANLYRSVLKQHSWSRWLYRMLFFPIFLCSFTSCAEISQSPVLLLFICTVA